MNKRFWLLTFGFVLFCYLATQASQQRNSTNASSCLIFANGESFPYHGNHRILMTVKLDFYGDTNIERGLVKPVSSLIFGGNNQSNPSEVLHDPSMYWKYFMATNAFCGLVELTNMAGERLSLLKPEVNSEAAYPDFYSIQSVRTHMAGRRIWESPFVLIPNDQELAQMREFVLEDYFKIEKPGIYTLTVWPKIYKRSTTNDDLCERMDFPPVTIPIKWNENSSN